LSERGIPYQMFELPGAKLTSVLQGSPTTQIRKMPKATSNSTLESGQSRLREIALAAKEGALLGSEEWLISELRVSRSTLRQAARLLEREGLLRVRRGIKGGYFGARPDEKTIQMVMSAYLDTLDMKYEDVTAVASVLWVEVLRRAAGLNHEGARKLAEYHRGKVLEVGDDATFHEIVEVEQASREAIFELVKSRYIQLIFHINQAFSVGRFPRAAARDGTPQHRAFVRAWREAKLLELSAIAEGDVELGMLAARRVRSIWHRRFWSKKPS
jgi:GntR family transcriptional repressor for pyruvate dehydrogenase complex